MSWRPSASVTTHDCMRATIQPGLSPTPVPIPEPLALALSAHVAEWGSKTVLVNELGRQLAPRSLEDAVQKARAKVASLPPNFRFHDLRHYFASLLIAGGSDVKVVQARLRHASAKTTLDTYGHLWPDSDESTRAVVQSAMRNPADYLRTEAVGGGRTPRSTTRRGQPSALSMNSAA